MQRSLTEGCIRGSHTRMYITLELSYWHTKIIARMRFRRVSCQNFAFESTWHWRYRSLDQASGDPWERLFTYRATSDLSSLSCYLEAHIIIFFKRLNNILRCLLSFVSCLLSRVFYRDFQAESIFARSRLTGVERTFQIFLEPTHLRTITVAAR